jgi:hypothetical protein
MGLRGYLVREKGNEAGIAAKKHFSSRALEFDAEIASGKAFILTEGPEGSRLRIKAGEA